jgi:drug/metabolite transporter (DMT)-like permease
MSYLLILVNILGETNGKIIDKYNFRNTNISPKSLIFWLFLSMFSLSFLLVSTQSRALPDISAGMILLFLFIILCSFGQNFFDFSGVALKDLSVREPIVNFQPLLTGLIAFLFFESERDLFLFLAIIIGSITLIWANTKSLNSKIQFDKGMTYLFLGILCSACVSNAYNIGLKDFSPETLFLIRSLGILLISGLFFYPKIIQSSKKQASLGLISGMVYFIGHLAKIYSISIFGLQNAVLLFMLSPVFMYLHAHFILKEKIGIKKLMASSILICLVILNLTLIH